MAMGARGPVARPRSLKVVRSDEADEAKSVADEVTPGAPAKPEGLLPAESDLWDLLVPQLDDLGLVATVDGLTIDLALRHYLAALQASDELADAASVALEDEAHGRLQKHPADAVFRLHSAAFLQYADRLGLAFVPRARLAARGGGDDDGDNPFATATGGG